MTRLRSFFLWTLAASLTLMALGADRGSAQPRRPALHWTRGPGAAACIDPSALAARVELLTGPVFVAPRETDYTIEAHIDARTTGGFVMRLSVSGLDAAPRGERTILHDESDCRAFDGTIAFVIALTIDPDLALEEAVPASGLADQSAADVLLKELTEHPPVPVLGAAPQAATATVAARSSAPTKKVEATPRAWAASLGAVTSRGELPAQSLGAVLGVAAPFTSWFSVVVQLRFSSTTKPVQLDGDYRLRTQALAGALLACARTSGRRSVVLTGCIGPESNVVRARGLGFSTDRSAYLEMWGALARVELAYEIKPGWQVALQGFVRENFEHKRLVYDLSGGPQRIHDFGPISGGIAICLIRSFSSGSAPSRSTDVRTMKERT